MAAYIGFAVSAIIGGLSGASGKRSAKSAKKREIARIRAQTAEEIRRRTGAFEREKSGGLAMAGASGFGVGDISKGQQAAGGGFGQVLKDMQTEFGLEVDWLERSAQAGIDVTEQEYAGVRHSIDVNTLGSIASNFNALGRSQNWWQ